MVECSKRVSYAVESAMKGEGKTFGCTNEAGCCCNVNSVLCIEGSTDNCCGSSSYSFVNISFHYADFSLTIDEATFARADKDMDSQVGKQRTQLTQKTDGGSESIQRECRTEFYALRAAFNGSECRRQASTTDFERIHFLISITKSAASRSAGSWMLNVFAFLLKVKGRGAELARALTAFAFLALHGIVMTESSALSS